jgi:hypothetical protein
MLEIFISFRARKYLEFVQMKAFILNEFIPKISRGIEEMDHIVATCPIARQRQVAHPQQPIFLSTTEPDPQ